MKTGLIHVAQFHQHYSILPTFFFFNDTATTEIYPLSLHDALPISPFASATGFGRPYPPRQDRRDRGKDRQTDRRASNGHRRTHRDRTGYPWAAQGIGPHRRKDARPVLVRTESGDAQPRSSQPLRDHGSRTGDESQIGEAGRIIARYRQGPGRRNRIEPRPAGDETGREIWGEPRGRERDRRPPRRSGNAVCHRPA